MQPMISVFQIYMSVIVDVFQSVQRVFFGQLWNYIHSKTVCILVHVCLCVYVYVFVCVSVFVHVHVPAHGCLQMFIYAYMFFLHRCLISISKEQLSFME